MILWSFFPINLAINLCYAQMEYFRQRNERRFLIAQSLIKLIIGYVRTNFIPSWININIIIYLAKLLMEYSWSEDKLNSLI